jgi:hypothetical protein
MKRQERTVCCKECGKEFTTTYSDKEHCGDACRKAWNNRRMCRGAELYDAFMTLRYERGYAKVVGAYKLMCRLAYYWRQDDKNRKTWNDLAKMVEAKPFLKNDIPRGV